MSRTFATLLFALLVWGIGTLWVPQPWALSGFQVGAFLLAAAWLGRPFTGRERLEFSPVLAPVAGIVCWGAAQLALRTTVAAWDTRRSVLTWAANLALVFVALEAGAASRARNRLLTLLAWFGFALAVLAVLQMYTSGGAIFWMFPSGYTDNVLGPFVNRNQYAACLELLLPIALWRGLSAERHRLLYTLLAATMAASVVASTSRAGVALITAETFFVLALSWWQGAPRGRIGRVAVQLVTASLVFSFLAGAGGLWARLLDPDPYARRREMLSSSIAMARARPGMGFGLGTWARVYPQFALYDDGTYVNQAHNDWAQAAAEGGLPMLAFLAAFAVLVAPAALRSGWGIGILAFLSHAAVDYPLQQRPALAGLFFVLAGLACARRQRLSTLMQRKVIDLPFSTII